MSQAKPRLFFLDNLKVLLITLVIVHHVGQAYGPTGGSWPISNLERAPLLGFLFAIDRSFFMSLFFMIAGYFVPGSLDRKGTWNYIKERCIKLGIPMLLFLLLMYPIADYLLAVFYQGDTSLKFWQYYFNLYWQNANLGPLWFVSVLLVLSICYTVFHQFNRRYKKIIDYLKTRSLNQILLVNILLIVIFTFLIRLYFPIDKWLNYIVFAVAPADFARDTAFFILGILAYRNSLLLKISRKQGYIWLTTALILAILFVLFKPITGSSFFFGGGLSLGALRYDLWEATFCTGMCIGLPVLFRETFNWTNKFWSTLSADAFAVYLFHALVVVAVQYCFVNINLAPSGKFFIVSILSVISTFIICHYIRKIPGVKNIL